jgi:D-alanine-D-alanine ligase
MKIVVMCGGLSPERNVSIASSALICKALRKLGHKAVMVDMFFGLEGFSGEPASLFEHLPPIPDTSVGHEAPDLAAIVASRKWKSKSKIGYGVLELCQAADLVFIGMHGACGEDGRIQATLDLLGVPYTGSGYLGSAIAMDKDLTKRVAASVGVRTPAWETVYPNRESVEDIVARTKTPCVVKPVDSGSSIGVSIAQDAQELARALEQSRCYERVVLEQYIRGREIDVAVLDGESLPSIEIIPKEGFYDYKNKYQAGAATEICPSAIDPAIEQELRQMALKVHNALGLSVYSRSDYMVDEKGDVYFIEMNTLPGMTPTSLMPQEAAAVGIDYEQLCQKIVEISLRVREEA